MSLADSLGPLIPPTPKRSDAQTPNRRNVEAPRLSAVPASRRSSVETSERSDAQTPKRSGVEWPETAWSQHPDFSKKTLYLHTDTHTDALRRYEDSNRGRRVTESMLLQMLLERFAGGDRG